jgi:hypothetical protein
MQWRIIRVSLCIWLSTASVGASYAVDREDAYSFYQFLRKDVQTRFEEAIKQLSNRRLPSATDEEFALAINLVKLTLYNGAYIAAECALLAPKGENTDTFVKDCGHERNQAFVRVYEQATAILKKGPVAKRLAAECLNRAMLPEAENQFPPYEFLAGPDTHLFDVKKLDGCLANVDR